MDKSEFVMLMLYKLSRDIKGFIDTEDWENDKKVITILGWSYIVFWEIINTDTSVQNRLRLLDIPCSKDYRNKLAHAGTVEPEILIRYAKGLTNPAFSDLMLDYFGDGLIDKLQDFYIKGSYGVIISKDSVN